MSEQKDGFSGANWNHLRNIALPIVTKLNFVKVKSVDDGKLYIYINPKHEYAPPAALAALLSHEALHQDEYNSLSEETYAWTMEANVWCEMLKRFPESNVLESPLVMRENVLKQLLEKGNYSNKYIKKTVYANEGYKNLPLTSPGFNAD